MESLLGSEIINMSRMIEGEFPPRLRKASLQSHGFSLFRQCSDEPLSTSILLMDVWDALKGFNPFIVEEGLKGL